MTGLLFLIPLFAVLSGSLLNKLNGRREIIKLDMSQFFYAFVMAPLLFVWLKSFAYVLLRREIEISLSQTQLFIIDTTISVFFLYIFAFVVMHSLTKSMKLQSLKDPLYDIFNHAEYFHLWLSHLVVYIGAMLVITILAMINVFFPLSVEENRLFFYLVCGVGVLSGIAGFVGIWLYEPEKGRANFMRVMKLSLGMFFALHVFVFFFFDPGFSNLFGMYWLALFMFATMVSIAFFEGRSERTRSFFGKIIDRFRQRDWSALLESKK